MSRFKKKTANAGAGISTASLPDIVFMLLFFFMVTTVMREVDLKVKLAQPEAKEIQKIENKSEVMYMYVGEPYERNKYGTEPRLQINDDFVEISDIRASVETFRATKDEALHGRLTTSLKVDKNVKMGVVTDIKQELRKAQQLKIVYATLPKN